MLNPEEVEPLVDMRHGGLLRRQPQPQRCEHGRHLLPQFLRVVPATRHHDHEVVGARETAEALGATSVTAGLVERRRKLPGTLWEQRGRDTLESMKQKFTDLVPVYGQFT